MSTKFNPKKNNRDKRIRHKEQFKAKKSIVYAEVKHKSNAGVEYIHYKPVVVNI